MLKKKKEDTITYNVTHLFSTALQVWGTQEKKMSSGLALLDLWIPLLDL